MYGRNLIFCFVCSAMVYESILGERHMHLPEQLQQTTLPQEVANVISSGTSLYMLPPINLIKK